MLPHGLECSFRGSIFEADYFHNSESIFQAYIEIENTKDNTKIVVPMRSFVSNFINILQKIFSGTGDATTRKSSVSWSGSTAKRAGLLIGDGVTPVVLSDDKLESQITHASVQYGNTTLIAPYAISGNPNQIIAEIKKLFSNNKATNLVISELGLSTKAVGASGASTAGVNMLSRDIVLGATEQGISVTSSGSIRFTLKFGVTQNSNGYGGFNLNFVKLVYNLLFKGNQNNANSLLVNYLNQSVNNYIYSSSAVAATTSPWYLGGSSTQPYIGIVLGTRYSDSDRNDRRENPDVSADERIMAVESSLTYDANYVTSVSNIGTNEAQFSITRNITNNTSRRILINRVGLLIRGNGNGASLNTQQAFIAITKIDNTYLEPGQTYKAMFTFKIKA